MKKILLSLAVILAAISINAQSFTLTWEGQPIGDTIMLYPDTLNGNITFHAVLNNNTDATADVIVARNEVSMLGTAFSDFCWGEQCWPPFVDTSTVLQVAAGGSTLDADFAAYYHPEWEIGISTVEYVFYDELNPETRVKVVVLFNNGVDAINESSLKNVDISMAYPNPASNQLYLDYKLPAEIKSADIKIMNLMGSVVKEQKFNNRTGKLEVNINDINSGVYFYSLFIDGEVYKTEKLIVK